MAPGVKTAYKRPIRDGYRAPCDSVDLAPPVDPLHGGTENPDGKAKYVNVICKISIAQIHLCRFNICHGYSNCILVILSSAISTLQPLYTTTTIFYKHDKRVIHGPWEVLDIIHQYFISNHIFRDIGIELGCCCSKLSVHSFEMFLTQYIISYLILS